MCVCVCVYKRALYYCWLLLLLFVIKSKKGLFGNFSISINHLILINNAYVRNSILKYRIYIFTLRCRIIKHRQRSRDFINSYNSLNITLNDMNIYVVIEYMYIRITREY